MYYNFKDIRANNTKEYQNLVEMLDEYAKSDEEGTKRIIAPTILFINKGKIVGVYVGTISSDKEELITSEEKKNLENDFSSLIDKMYIEETTAEETIQ